jgi:hypothetical protein
MKIKTPPATAAAPRETFFINYDLEPLVEVHITDRALADPVIREMVHFWSDDAYRLSEAKGDYTEAFLGYVARFCCRENRVPGKGDEGWYPLDGAHGIEAVEFYPVDLLDEGLIEIS